MKFLGHVFELPVARASARRALAVVLLDEEHVGDYAAVQFVQVCVVDVRIPEIIAEEGWLVL